MSRNFYRAEYIWMDGARPTQHIRSKTRILPDLDGDVTLETFPEWGYDGSSTYQASGDASDLKLVPVRHCPDPVRGPGNYLVLCEVMNIDNTPHKTNTRARLRKVLDAGGDKVQAWFGFEQEYTLFQGTTPLGWPTGGYPPPQGPFYCGVGSDEVYGRDIVEAHSEACIDAGLMLFGINAEVMPAQWEFQVGFRGVMEESADPLTVADHLWMSRWLLYRVAEEAEVNVSLSCKPMRGDWNGAGLHTNFSTAAMREAATGRNEIESVIANLGKKHDEHIDEYGAGLSKRLTGDHETCHINDFKHGVSNRGASIRIPSHVAEKGYGYIEDRRPGANADPYRVCALIINNGCAIGADDTLA